MKRVLLLGLNARYVHSNLAILYLRNYIAHLCPDTVVHERGINEKDDKILDAIIAESPDVVAISVYIWNSRLVRSLIPRLCEMLPYAVIVLGGPDAGYNADEWMRSGSAPDYIIAGAGEAGFMKLAQCGFSCEERIIRETNPPFATIPFPYNESDMLRLAGRFLYYESSRGCPFRCSYCLSSRQDQRLDLRPVDMVRDELDFIASYRPALVKFVDRTFNSRREHYRQIWEHIVTRCSNGRTKFHFEIYPGMLDDDDLNFLAGVPSGLFQFEIGIQSANTGTLQAIHRVMDRNSYSTIEQIINRGNIHVHLDLIAGLPLEDYTSFKNSFNRVMALAPHHFQPGILKVLPGTEMMEKSCEYGLAWSSEPPYTVRSTAWLSEHELDRIILIAELVERIYNSKKFIQTEKWLVSLAGGSFGLYEKLAAHGDSGSARHWEEIAFLLTEFVTAGSPETLPLLMDHLRWDWCASGTVHHYPALLKSPLTTEAKRSGYTLLMRHSVNNVISINGESFTQDELRHSIFFVPETVEFREKMMKGDMALFLPDKQVVYFDMGVMK